MANLSEKLGQDYYERAWENWNERSALGPASRQVRRLVINMIRGLDYDSYLDAGCGEGSLLREIHIQYPKAEVCGVDLSQKGIEIAQRNNPGISIFQLDLIHQTLSRKFDLVTCVDVLEHIEDDEGVLHNLHKMTNRYLLLVTPIGRLLKEENIRLGHVHGYSKDEVRQKLHQAGFHVIKEMEWGFPFYTLYRRMMLHIPEKSITGHFDWKKRLISAFTYHLLFLNLPFWEIDTTHFAMPKNRLTINKNSILTLLGTLVFIIICAVELKAIYWAGLDKLQVFSISNGAAFLLYFLLSLFALLILVSYLFRSSHLQERIIALRPKSWVKWAFAILLCLFPVWFFSFSAWGLVFRSTFLHLWCFASMVMLVSWLISESFDNSFSFKSILQSILLVGGIFLIGDKLKEVVDYPFSMYWSEGNRFWDYSLLFARNLYDYPQSQPIFAFIDLGRQSLWGLPFLFGNVSITMMRFWNVLLFTLVYILFGFLVFKRKNTSKSLTLLLGLWAFIFLNQGPIYTPLILCAMLVWVAGEAPLAISLLLLIASSYYANLTRYTWSVAPAIWGVLLALFHKSSIDDGANKIDWVRVIGSGLAGLFGGLVLPILIPLSTNGATQEFQGAIVSSAASTLQSQQLIWSRLWPNETFAPGIALGILLATLPLLLILIIFIKQNKIKLNLWQILAIIGSCLAFLAVGLIASIKIGGGSNLHNLDMLFINLLILAGIAWKLGGQEWLQDFRQHSRMMKILLLILIIYPLYPTIFTTYPIDFPSRQEQNNTVAYIQKSVNEAKNIGPVLFIDQRQLLTFGLIKDVPLVPDYEKKYLMDRAMSGDKSYFMKFYEDLRNHRFALIINEPSYLEYQSEEISFGTENDIWVDWVVEPTLCYYRILRSYKVPSVELLIPRVFPPDPAWNCP